MRDITAMDFFLDIIVLRSECCFKSKDKNKAIYDFRQDLIVTILPRDPHYYAMITNIAFLTCAGPSQSPQTVSRGGP